MHNQSIFFQGNTFALLRIMLKYGNISISKCLNVSKYLLRSFLLTPFYFSELMFRSKKIKQTKIQDAPIFIIGHYRSGTTYIHKLLSCDKRWGNIRTADFLYPFHSKWLLRIVKPVIQFLFNIIRFKNPHFNNYLLDLDDPMEEDMVTIGSFSQYSAFWGEVFPRNFKEILKEQIMLSNPDDKKNWQSIYMYLLKKITLKNDGKRLLLKNPPNTGRVNHILELFPDAKFVFIYRNPYRVYYSTYNLWKNLLEKSYAFQIISEKERQEDIFFGYKTLMGSYLKEKENIPPNNLIEIKYEELKNDPLKQIESIYEQLKLGEFENVKPVLEELLAKEKEYSTYTYSYDDDTQNRIYKAWGPFIDHWNYHKLTND